MEVNLTDILPGLANAPLSHTPDSCRMSCKYVTMHLV